jgi:hypothetical protein
MPASVEPTKGTILVYLCNGEVRELPDGKRVDVRGDCVVCLDDHNRELVRFKMRDVYMCTSKPVPRALL